MPKTKTVLQLEDDADISDLLEYFLGTHGYKVITARDVESARAAISVHMPEAVIVDWHLAGNTAEEFVQWLRATNARTVIILTSGMETLEETASRLRLRYCLKKPYEMQALVDLLNRTVA